MAFEPLVKGKKVKGVSFSNESLTGALDFYQIRTTLDISLDGEVKNDHDAFNGDPTDVSQQRFDRLVEVFGLRAQPVVIGEITEETVSGPVDDLPVTSTLASGDTVKVYTVVFASEHKNVWTEEQLASNLNNVAPRDMTTGEPLDPFVFDSVDPVNNNVAIYKNQFLTK